MTNDSQLYNAHLHKKMSMMIVYGQTMTTDDYNNANKD